MPPKTKGFKLSGKLAERSKARNTPGIVLPAVKEGMLRDYGVDTSRRWGIVHPSELSHQDKFCARAVYLRITGGPVETDSFDFVRENIFEEGNRIHTKWQNRLRKYTDLWGDWKCLVCKYVEHDTLEPEPYDTYINDGPACASTYGHIWEYIEVNLDAESEALLCGHADGGIVSARALQEFKSVGEGTVRIEAPGLYMRHTDERGTDLKALWKDITRPFATHLNQGDIYLWIAQQRGLPFDKISYVYESKWNQQVKEYVIDYSEERSLKLVDQARAVKYAVEHQKEPACRKPGECSECKPYDARNLSKKPGRTVQVRS